MTWRRSTDSQHPEQIPTLQCKIGPPFSEFTSYMYPNEEPGLGIDIDEKEAAKYPCPDGPPQWTLTRIPDGTAVRP